MGERLFSPFWRTAWASGLWIMPVYLLFVFVTDLLLTDPIALVKLPPPMESSEQRSANDDTWERLVKEAVAREKNGDPKGWEQLEQETIARDRIDAQKRRARYEQETIVRDINSGVWALIQVPFVIALVAATWRRWFQYSSMVLWMWILWEGRRVATGIAMMLKCSNVFGPGGVTMPWATWESFQADPWIRWAEIIHRVLFWAVVAVIMAMLYHKRKVREAQAKMAQ